jgi:hypothetical protein
MAGYIVSAEAVGRINIVIEMEDVKSPSNLEPSCILLSLSDNLLEHSADVP